MMIRREFKIMFLVVFLAMGVSFGFSMAAKDASAVPMASEYSALVEQAKQQKRIADTLEKIHKELRKIRMEMN